MNQKYILGISCFYHDASATLIKDGKELDMGTEFDEFSKFYS